MAQGQDDIVGNSEVAEKEPQVEAQLHSWLRQQRPWLQHAALVILRGEKIDDDRITELAQLALSEAKDDALALPEQIPLTSLGHGSTSTVVINSISNVKGTGKLNPKRALEFAPTGITVVYGTNGSGKSSYVRLLKHACGTRAAGKLYGNVFDEVQEEPTCSIAFQDEGSDGTVQWKETEGAIDQLRSVDIYDTSTGDTYLKDENPPSYEPRIISFMGDLARLMSAVADKLKAQAMAMPSVLPTLPAGYGQTTAGKWYGLLNADTKVEVIDEYCNWSDALAEEYRLVKEQLAESSPALRAKEKRIKKKQLDTLVANLDAHIRAYSNEAFKVLLKLKENAVVKRKAAQMAAKLLEEVALPGVGSEPWVELWDHAKAYSQQFAYPAIEFPNTGEDSRCVLCQQPLSEEAKDRFKTFESYVADQASQAAAKAQADLNQALDDLPTLPTAALLEQQAEAIGIPQARIEELKGFYEPLRKRQDEFRKATQLEGLTELVDHADWRKRAVNSSAKLETEAQAFDKAEQTRQANSKRQGELEALKWVTEQKVAIHAEVERQGKVAQLERARSYCNTGTVTRQVGVLAEQVVTPRYIKAFNDELKALQAQRIQVEMVRSAGERGTITHMVRLKDLAQPKVDTRQILSEGEHRIVSLAAFLADTGGNPKRSTFIFDDPISSLDIAFEEAVVMRLVELSKTRQVIVFTHRLSLMGMVQDYAKKEGQTCTVVQVRSEPWGAGEPGDQGIDSAKLKAILNEHLPAKVRAAQEVHETEGTDAYHIHAQQICTETRKVVERLVEEELFNGVILRHRRAINTMGKLDKLALISMEDCQFIDEFMSKYSRYEHAQSQEAPVSLPTPEELLEDLERLKGWRKEYSERK